MKDFSDYFSREWLNGKFNQWQIHNTPPGFASTDNPAESFNAVLKRFTNREQLPVPLLLEVILKQVFPFYANHHREFLFFRSPNTECRSVANLMELKDFCQVNETIVTYTGKSSINQVNFQHNSCTCRWYLAYAMCAHVVAACRFFGKALNTRLTKRNYVYRSKRGRTAKTTANPAKQYKRARLDAAVADTQAQAQVSTQLEEKEDCELVGTQSEPPLLLQVKRGRGRPRLTEAQKEERKKERKKEERKKEGNKKGRRKKAGLALTDD